MKTKEDFEKLMLFNHHVNKIHQEGKELVLAYIQKNVPEHNGHDPYRVDFEWEEDGIHVMYDIKTGGPLSMEEEGKEGVSFRLTYKDVFGWTIDDWKKPINASKYLKKAHL